MLGLNLKGFTPSYILVLVALIGAIVWWIRGMPERIRARMESDASLRRDLMEKINHLELQRLEDRKQCHAEQQELRDQLEEMQKRFDSVVRQFITYQLTVAQAIPPEAKSVHIARMLESLEPLLMDQPPHKKDP
jgi:hypothetical protein